MYDSLGDHRHPNVTCIIPQLLLLLLLLLVLLLTTV
jgi:hypothetical protein